MNFIVWIVLGALAGWAASVVMKTDAQQGVLINIIFGITGALVGGFLMNIFGEPGVTGFNIYSLFVALIGAVALIALGKMFRRTV
ncbi:MAG: GlsB/YeaQ/YmgE family stress response membrane protein [Candidatus Levybacteria bacterium]|nr:GlsB/YeaQ/YmgE family stress response membrane protein [Candidatus Levybacteria bacterium]